MFVCHQDELLAELDELQQEEMDRSLLEIGRSENVNLPNVPSTSLHSRTGTTTSLPLNVLFGKRLGFFFLSYDLLEQVSNCLIEILDFLTAKSIVILLEVTVLIVI